MFNNPGAEERFDLQALNVLVDLLSGTDNLQALVALRGSAVIEAYTQDQADGAGVVTFGAPIEAVEVWHDEATPQSFTVNGIVIPIAPGGWRSLVAGVPSAEVTIPLGINCTVARLV